MFLSSSGIVSARWSFSPTNNISDERNFFEELFAEGMKKVKVVPLLNWATRHEDLLWRLEV
jgi:hypothetical protein